MSSSLKDKAPKRGKTLKSASPAVAPRQAGKASQISPALIAKILKILQNTYPDAKCELHFNTPYQLLVAVILSAQTTDKMVNRAMKAFFDLGAKPQDILALGFAGFYEKIRSIGLARQKAKNILRTTEILMAEFAGQVPSRREDLEKLPGVGRKTASVILGEVFHQPTLAVDTHVFRVTQRLGLHDEKTPEACEQKLLTIIPENYRPLAHHLFIWHGRYACKARNPKCDSCGLAKYCTFKT